MELHANAKLGLAGRIALVETIRSGATWRAAAAAFNVAPATAHRWGHRFVDALPATRQSVAWALDRSSRPHRSPRLLPEDQQLHICEVRQATGWGPRLVAGVTGDPHQTVWKVLRRHGLSRPQRKPREDAHRYEWPCPGTYCTWMSRPMRAFAGQATR